MIASEFAELLNARKVGQGKWIARCPSHQDGSPSLSIREGRDGRVLLHCFAGCGTDPILTALKLSRHDLFQGPPPSPAQRAALESRREAMEQEKRAKRAVERETWDRIRRWTAVVNALGAKLAREPDDAPNGDSLTRTFHAACEQLTKAETAALMASGARAA